MNLLCAICQDLMEPSNDIFVTPCGHVFHFPCLTQWMEKSLTCPQCRQKIKRGGITRIYFNFSEAEAVKEDSVTLLSKLDNLKFQVKLKEKEFTNCLEEVRNFKKQNIGLKEEVKRCESVISEKKSAIFALKQQSEYFKEKLVDYTSIKEQKIKLEKKLETYENIKTLICSTSDQVDHMLNKTSDVTTLCTYVGIMKRELSTSLDKRKELRSTIKRLQQELQSLKMEKQSFTQDYIKKIEALEEALALSKSENDVLQKRISELENSHTKDRKLVEEPKSTTKAVSRKRETDLVIDLDVTSAKKYKFIPQSLDDLSTDFGVKDDSDVVLASPYIKKTKENEENSPYLLTKTQSLFALKERTTQNGGFSLKSKRNIISSKKSESAFKSTREQDSEIAFDGFGGHAKIEVFPKTSPTKLKRSINDSSKNKKVKLDLTNTKKLDSYVINLT